MTIYSPVTKAMTREGVAFVLTTLGNVLGTEATIDAINQGIKDQGADDITVDIDDLGLQMTVVTPMTKHSEWVRLSDLGINVESIDLLGKRFLNTVRRLQSLADQDLAVVYDACDDDYYDDDDYSWFDDDDDYDDGMFD